MSTPGPTASGTTSKATSAQHEHESYSSKNTNMLSSSVGSASGKSSETKPRIATLPGYDDSGEHEFVYRGRTDDDTPSDENSDLAVLYSRISRNVGLGGAPGINRMASERSLSGLGSIRNLKNAHIIEDYIPTKDVVYQEMKKRFVEVDNPVRIHGNHGVVVDKLNFLKKEIEILEHELHLSIDVEEENEVAESANSTKSCLEELKKLQSKVDYIQSYQSQISLSKQLNQIRTTLRKEMENSYNFNTNNNTTDGNMHHKTFHLDSRSLINSVGAASYKHFDMRLRKLEKLLLSQSSTSSSIENLEETLQDIENRMNLLNPDTLQALHEQIKSTRHMMNISLETHEIEPQTISKLYHTMQYWKTFGNELPILIDRLHSLRSIHDEEIDFVQAFRDLKEKASKLEDVFSNQKDILNTVNQNLESNLGIFEKNIKILDERIERISRLKSKK